MEALTAGAMGRPVMGALLLQMSLARRLESQERRLSTTCFDLVLTDSWADGWDTGTYVVMDAAGSAAASGTLAAGSTETVSICLAEGCYSLAVLGSEYPSEVGFDFGSGFASGDGTYAATPRATKGCFNGTSTLECLGDHICVKNHASTLRETLKRDDHRGDPNSYRACETSEYGHLQDSREIQREPSKAETVLHRLCRPCSAAVDETIHYFARRGDCGGLGPNPAHCAGDLSNFYAILNLVRRGVLGAASDDRSRDGARVVLGHGFAYGSGSPAWGGPDGARADESALYLLWRAGPVLSLIHI